MCVNYLVKFASMIILWTMTLTCIYHAEDYVLGVGSDMLWEKRINNFIFSEGGIMFMTELIS